MFDTNSRYRGIEMARLEVSDRDGAGRSIAYVRRRFVPPAAAGTTLVEHTLAQGERLDLIAARYLGDPTQFWRICDANNVMHPDELDQAVGRTIIIALALG